MISAAADALNQPPRDVRPTVAAIFSRVRDLGPIDLAGLVKLLAGEDPEAAPRKKPRP